MSDYQVERTLDQDPYRYDLIDGELDEIESKVLGRIREAGYDDQPIVAVVVDSTHWGANFGRTYEQRTFDDAGEHYDFKEGYKKYEDNSVFVFTVDTEAGAIAHVKRVVFADSAERIVATGKTGIEMIDDRINAVDPAEHMNLDDIMHHLDLDVQGLASSANVATNQTTKRVQSTREKPHVFFSYKAVYELLAQLGVENQFAYQNEKARRSLGKMGVEAVLLAGREFHLPLVPSEDGYDTNYVALRIPSTEQNRRAFIDPERTTNPLVRLVASQTLRLYDLQD